ncbi:DNA polymerase III subunit [Gordonia phage Jeanie]|uniref:DNA polymerase III subunit n=2 Tax=root TaxID=1 RepID=A0A166YGY3_9CAUD|nr:exonuclease domain-containing protein [Gordonia neofelifaecis]YP_009274038.1 DNA polymerase III subunit epsilon [Gordonia phage McGonagall]ANA87603.1 DNA polymerase III subunit [Gordonia phage McGonagall]ANA87630.1 DNA polymerase III subunit [Gordonia phage Jeanie]EGD53226.1 DNA polymerase III subunit epsilon [Gordonia neofelifaecis NRRL B-59395]
MTHRYVALDLETTGLNTLTACPLEIGAVEILENDPRGPYGRVLGFVPHTPDAVLHKASPDALAVNRFYERRLYAAMLRPAETADMMLELVELLRGATLVGANVAYDAAILWAWLATFTDDETPPWHFRLYDVELATEVALNLDRTPSLRSSCELWNVDTDRDAAHTALGDAYMAADVFLAVRAHCRGDEPDQHPANVVPIIPRAVGGASVSSASSRSRCLCHTSELAPCPIHNGPL